MEEIVQFITGGADTFTPSVIVGIIVFCVIFDGICNLVSSMIGGISR